MLSVFSSTSDFIGDIQLFVWDSFGLEKIGGPREPEDLRELFILSPRKVGTRKTPASRSKDERQPNIVQYRFFGGLTYKEIANVVGGTQHSVRYDWRVVRAWLKRE